MTEIPPDGYFGTVEGTHRIHIHRELEGTGKGIAMEIEIHTNHDFAIDCGSSYDLTLKAARVNLNAEVVTNSLSIRNEDSKDFFKTTGGPSTTIPKIS